MEVVISSASESDLPSSSAGPINYSKNRFRQPGPVPQQAGGESYSGSIRQGGSERSMSPTISDMSSIRLSPRHLSTSSHGGGHRPHPPTSASTDRNLLEVKQEWNSNRLGPPGPRSQAGSDVGDQSLMPPGSAMSVYASSFTSSLSPFPIEMSPSGSSFNSPTNSARTRWGSKKRPLSLSPLSAEGLFDIINTVIRTSPTSLGACISGSRGSPASISPFPCFPIGDYGHLSVRNSSSPMSQVSSSGITCAVSVAGSVNGDKMPPPYQVKPPENTYDATSPQVVTQQMQEMERGGQMPNENRMNNQLIVQPQNEAIQEFTNFNSAYQGGYKQEPIEQGYPQTTGYSQGQVYTPGQFPPPAGQPQPHGVPVHGQPQGPLPQQDPQAPRSHPEPNPAFTQNQPYSTTPAYPPNPAYTQPSSYQPANYPIPGNFNQGVPAPYSPAAVRHPSMTTHPLPANMPPPPPYHAQHYDTNANHSPPIINTNPHGSPVTTSTPKLGLEAQEEKICRWIDCNAFFEEQEELVRHIEKVHIDQRKGEDFTCFWQACTRRYKPFNARYKLLIHMRVHSGEKPNKCTVSTTCCMLVVTHSFIR